MLAQADIDDTGPRAARGAAERTCIVTRAVKPVDELIRFVVAPDGAVVADLKRRLPGRGVWVTAQRETVSEAVKRKAFGRARCARDRPEGRPVGNWLCQDRGRACLRPGGWGARGLRRGGRRAAKDRGRGGAPPRR